VFGSYPEATISSFWLMFWFY